MRVAQPEKPVEPKTKSIRAFMLRSSLKSVFASATF